MASSSAAMLRSLTVLGVWLLVGSSCVADICRAQVGICLNLLNGVCIRGRISVCSRNMQLLALLGVICHF
jgi:hypothetical protein